MSLRFALQLLQHMSHLNLNLDSPISKISSNGQNEHSDIVQSVPLVNIGNGNGNDVSLNTLLKRKSSQKISNSSSIICNTFRNNGCITFVQNIVYAHQNDMFQSNINLRTTFKNILKDRSSCKCQIIAIDPSTNSPTRLHAIIKKVLPHPMFQFYQVQIKLAIKSESKEDFKYISRILRMPTDRKEELSILELEEELKLSIIQKYKQYGSKENKGNWPSVQSSKICIHTFVNRFDLNEAWFELVQGEIKQINLSKMMRMDEIIELQIDQPKQMKYKQTKYHINIDNNLIDLHLKTTVLFDIRITHHDRHIQIPLTINPEHYYHHTISAIKQQILSYLTTQFKHISSPLFFNTFQIIKPDKTILQDQHLLKHHVHSGINIFTIESKQHLNKIKLILSNQLIQQQQTILNQKRERTALLFPHDQIKVKGKFNFQNISVAQLQNNFKIHSCVLKYEKDREYSITFQKRFTHQVFCSTIVISYQNKKQIFELIVHEDTVIIYGESAAPMEYSYCTAGNLCQLFHSGRALYIFDWQNSSLKVLNIKRQRQCEYKMCSFETVEKEQDHMIMINGIRILNLAVLDAPSVFINIEQLPIHQSLHHKIKQNHHANHQKILYFYEKQLSMQTQRQKFSLLANQEQQLLTKCYELSQKTFQNNSIYINSKMHHLVHQASSNKNAKDYYENERYACIQESEMCYIQRATQAQKENNYSIIFVKQSTKLYDQKPKMLTDKEKRYFLRLKLNNYIEQNGDKFSKPNSYYLITKRLVSNEKQTEMIAIELENPSFKSDIMVLWVDDNPINNKSILPSIQKQAQSLGINIEFNEVISTQSALAWISLFYPIYKWINPTCKIKLITDMYRKQSKQAGVDVIDQIERLRIKIQYSIFVSNEQMAYQIAYNRKLLQNLHVLITTDANDILKWCLNEPTLKITLNK